MTALVVEGDVNLRGHIRDQLQSRGVQVTQAGTVAEAAAAIATRAFLVVIVDVALSDGSGFEVLDLVRRAGSTSHVIVLSGSASEHARIEALERGADDFVPKPFFPRELAARVLAVRRRQDPARDALIQLGRCEIDLRAREVTCSGEIVNLTAKEFDLLAFLAARPGNVFSREQLLNAVWRSTSGWQQPATVTEHIRRLRNKIELDPRHPTTLCTVRGAGYRLDLPSDDDHRPRGRPPSDKGTIVNVDGQIVFADEVAADLLGFPEGAALVGKGVLELVDGASRAAVLDRLEGPGNGRPRRSELVDIRRVDGELMPVALASGAAEWQGEPARKIEITALSDAPSRLRRLITGLLADVNDAVVITDLHFHIRSWNSGAERIYGWDEEAVLGRHVLDVLPWVGDAGHPAELWQELERKGRWIGSGLQLARDGSAVEVLGSVTLLRDEHEEPIAVVLVNRLAEVAGHRRALAFDAALEARVEQGIEDDEFEVHYQPIVDIAQGHVVALEALVRWAHPDRGLLLPAEFLDAAERSGLIVPLGEMVLAEACGQAAEWRGAGADIALSVNVSARQLGDPGLPGRVTEILRASGLDPTHLWLEITETALVEELETAAGALRELAELGVGVSIDDFGTGWASLTYLQKFPVHTLKIDRSFIADAGPGTNDDAIVRSVLSLGFDLGLVVVAEGIETQAQHARLESLGCTLGQGHFYGRPTPAEQVPIERARVRERALAHAGTRSPEPAYVPSAGVAARALGPESRARAEVTLDLARGPEATPPGGHPAEPVGATSGWVEFDAVSGLLRALLRAETPAGAADVLQRTIVGLGGAVVPADRAGEDALPIDVSLGEGPPMLVEVERSTVARMHLERVLPRLVEDARQAVGLLRRKARLEDPSIRRGPGPPAPNP